jgi:hypothetical protein
MQELEGERERLLEMHDQSSVELATRLQQLQEKDRARSDLEVMLRVGSRWE